MYSSVVLSTNWISRRYRIRAEFICFNFASIQEMVIMVNVTVHKLRDIDLEELSHFTFNTLQFSLLRDDSRTLEKIEESYDERANDENEVIIQARESKSHELRGILGLYTGFPRMAFISSWHPLVQSSLNKRKTSQALIRKCVEFVRDNGFNRLESYLNPIREGFEEIRHEYQSMYEKEGFHQAGVEVSMKIDMKDWKLHSQVPELPKGYRFEEIGDRTNKEIEETFFESFRNSKARLFLDMTRAEQQVSFNHWMNRKREFHHSTVLVTDGNGVIGFSIARPQNETVNIGPIGLHPMHRGKGIAQALVFESLRRIKLDNQSKFAVLEVDEINIPAMKVYTRLGFSPQFTQEFYALVIS